MAWLLYFSARGAPLTSLQAALLVTHAVGAGLTLLWWWAFCRRLVGRPVGPSRDFVCALKEQPQTPPPPPNPNLEVWKPWFSLYGPLFLELNNATGRVPTAWRGRAHEYAAHRFYVEDRLTEAIRAAEQAIRNGTRPGLWAVKLLSIARAELGAREASKRVEHPPFVFELPETDDQYQALVEVADACSARVESMLGFARRPTMFTLLDPEDLRRDAGSRWGYLVPKKGFAKICLLRPSQDGRTEASIGLVQEYVRMALHELTHGRAPMWLTEGLADWMVCDVLAHVPTTEESPGQPRRLALSEKALDFMVRRSPIDRMAATGATAQGIVRHLIETYGEAAMAQFVRDLAHRTEARAFRAAFGQSQHQFERQWAARTKDVA